MLAARLFTAALALLPLSAAAQVQAPDSVAVYTAAFERAAADSDYAQAALAAARLAELEPADWTHRYFLARALHLDGRSGDAVRELRSLLDDDFELIVYALGDPVFAALRADGRHRDLFAAIEARTAPVESGAIAFTVDDPTLIPEGIAHDPRSGDFFLSSLHHCKIVRVRPDGAASDFTAPFQDGLAPVVGLHVDATRRHLWAASSYGYGRRAHLPDSLWGASGLFCFDIDTGGLLRRASLDPAEEHFLNDVVIADDGSVYATDSRRNAVYRLRPGSEALEKLADTAFAPNGIDLSADQSHLYLGGSDIAVMDLATGTITPLDRRPGLALSADGLCRRDDSLIVVQNGSLNSIRRLRLNAAGDAVVSVETLEANLPTYAIPTTGVLVGDAYYYIANSQLRAYTDGKQWPRDRLEPVQVRRIPLD